MSAVDRNVSSEILLARVSQGDEAALWRLFDQHRPYLRRLLEARMEPKLKQRVDPSDIIQDALLAAVKRVNEILAVGPASFRLWIRRKTMEQMIDTRRRHFSQKRDARREAPLSKASSMALARSLISQAASGPMRRKELMEEVHKALESMNEIDREILVLRNVELLSNAEVAELLGLDPKTASKRYRRAVVRLAERIGSD